MLGGRSRFGVELLVRTRIASFGNSSFVTEFEITAPPDDSSPGSSATIATAELTSVCVDSKTGTPVRVPDVLRNAVAAFEKAGPAT